MLVKTVIEVSCVTFWSFYFLKHEHAYSKLGNHRDESR